LHSDSRQYRPRLVARRRPRAVAGLVLLCGAVLLLPLLLSGCGGASQQQMANSRVQPFTTEEQEFFDAASSAEYRLRPGDMFRVIFKYETDLNQHNITILPDGRFSMAGMENVMAAGMTLAELDDSITAHFAADYRSPELSVVMEQLSAAKVYVFGNVNAPGPVDLPPMGGNVIQAIASAGGFKPGASPDETVLIRITPEGYLLRRVSLAHIEKQPMNAEFWDVQPYDVIFVPQSAIGDFGYFGDMVLRNLYMVSRLFWDVYAISHLNQIDRLVR